VALKAIDLATLAYRVSYLLTHPSSLAAMRAKAMALARPDAAPRALAIAMQAATP
jgi:processive 1,2-diacylglycerol beta-glucosyltransferase